VITQFENTSEADAVTLTDPETVAPFAGEVIEVVGDALSTGTAGSANATEDCNNRSGTPTKPARNLATFLRNGTAPKNV